LILICRSQMRVSSKCSSLRECQGNR